MFMHAADHNKHKVAAPVLVRYGIHLKILKNGPVFNCEAVKMHIIEPLYLPLAVRVCQEKSLLLAPEGVGEKFLDGSTAFIG